MLSAVSARADPFGGLSGYKFGEGLPPRGRGEGWQNPSKAAAAPGGQVPAPRITSSAAHPGRKSNSTVPYTRVCSLDASRIAGRPGHVTFVSAQRAAFGGAGTQRRSLMCGLEALNRMLKRDRKAGVNLLAKTAPPARPANPFADWRGLSVLQEWRLDGVVLGNPDESNSNPTFDLIDGASVQTTAMNIAVAGIAPVVDIFKTDAAVDLESQTELYIALVFTESADHYTYCYVPLTSNGINHPSTPHARDVLRRVVGAWRVGTVVDKAAAVGGWDNPAHALHRDDTWRNHWPGDEGAPEPPPKLIKSSHERRATVNVVVEWVDWRQLRAQSAQDYWDTRAAGVGSEAIARFHADDSGSPLVALRWPSRLSGNAPVSPNDDPTESDLALVADEAKLAQQRAAGGVLTEDAAALRARWVDAHRGSTWFEAHYQFRPPPAGA
jgi:hypothetical protein